MKMLITGGTVFVSRYTAEYFVCREHEVYEKNRDGRPQPARGTLVESDRHSVRGF